MKGDHDDASFDEPTPEERAEADALKAYLEGRGAPPSNDVGAAVGLIREAGSVDAVARDAGWRQARSTIRRQAAFWPIALPASFAAAAVIAFFLWPRAAVLPPGPSADQLQAAVRVLSTATPLAQRLGTLHDVASAARRRLLAEIAQSERSRMMASRDAGATATLAPQVGALAALGVRVSP